MSLRDDAPTIPTLPSAGELERTDPDDLRYMLSVDRALAQYFSARADLVAAALASDSRNGSAAHPVSAALDVAAVAARTGMSRQWIYRQARAGHLPFCRRLGRRLVFDEPGLARWLERRRAR